MVDRGSKGLEMALNEIFYTLYVVDILYYTGINDSWGIGVPSCYYYADQNA
jgi:hypothetical protein